MELKISGSNEETQAPRHTLLNISRFKEKGEKASTRIQARKKTAEVLSSSSQAQPCIEIIHWVSL